VKELVKPDSEASPDVVYCNLNCGSDTCSSNGGGGCGCNSECNGNCPGNCQECNWFFFL
jgi:hypothetical protein